MHLTHGQGNVCLTQQTDVSLHDYIEIFSHEARAKSMEIEITQTFNPPLEVAYILLCRQHSYVD